MWRFLRSHCLHNSLLRCPQPFLRQRSFLPHPSRRWSRLCSATTSHHDAAEVEQISILEVKKVIRLMKVEALKQRLGMMGEEVIGYAELLEMCRGMGVVRTRDEAVAFARVLDEAGVILLLREKVYLHPSKFVNLVRRAVPALTPEDDPRREELKKLEKLKNEIDMLAHKQVRRILWSGLGVFGCQVGLLFRLTFWELSWDVMEPIAYFTTIGLAFGYASLRSTSRGPVYQYLVKKRQQKLLEKQNFDMERFKELQDLERWLLL